ncbi:Yip1 family protein [Mesonia aquimarina]|uniref:Yip1 family protein n=1 Tax=Mesonia aquimarina TaxID=1504967 RepID=UPI000EF5C963|nr:Yip1 family protein [Mesonia aquimarina]
MEELEVKNNQILKNIWFQPSKTLRYMLMHKSKYNAGLLMLLGAIAYSFYKAVDKNVGDESSLYNILFIRSLIGTVVGVISFYIFSALLSVTGKWIGGKAEDNDFRFVLSWSFIPAIVGLFLLLLSLFIFGNDIFSSEIETDETWYEWLYSAFLVVYFVLNFWSLVIFIKGIKIIQNFSTLKSIVNLLMPAIAFIIIIVLLFALFNLFNTFS